MLETKTARKSGTFFLVPFHYDDPSLEPSDYIWKKQEKPVSNEGNRIKADADENREVLYAHIMDFLQGQTHSQGVNVSPLRIYSVVSDNGKEESLDFGSKFWKPFCKKPHTVVVDKKSATRVSFNLDSRNSYRPTLYMNDQSCVGVMVIYVTSECSTEDLIKLNYTLHKIGNVEAKCSTDAFKVDEKKIKNPSDLERALQSARQTYHMAYHLLSGKDEEEWENGALEWDMGQLVNLLLHGGHQKEKHFRLFNNIRLHLLTYAIVDDRSDAVGVNDCDETLLYLARCCAPNYILPVKDMVAKGAVLHTFDNIHITSFSEGCAIMAVGKNENWSFIEGFDAQIRMRFFWVYLLALLQRYVMFNISRKLMNVVSSNNQSDLWDLLEVYKQIKSTCYWTEVSPFTQHTQFYEHCCRGLRLKESYAEIESKTEIIRLVDEHALREAVDRQDSMHAARERRLSLLVAFLTVAQVVGVVFAMTEGGSPLQWILTSVFGVVMIIILLYVMKIGKKSH